MRMKRGIITLLTLPLSTIFEKFNKILIQFSIRYNFILIFSETLFDFNQNNERNPMTPDDTAISLKLN